MRTVSFMRRNDGEAERPAGAAREDEAEPRRASEDDGRVPSPDPEEVPELLGERSDYPVPRGEPR